MASWMLLKIDYKRHLMDLSRVKFEQAIDLDAKFIALEHKNAFQDGFLRHLEVDILANNFYKVILGDDNFDSIKLIVDGEYAGMLVIKKKLHKKVKFDYLSLIKPILKVVILNPVLLKTFWSIFVRKVMVLFTPSLKSFSEVYIFYIAKQFQSQKIGTVVLDKYFNEHTNRKYIVETTSSFAYKMYRRIGFKDLSSRFKFFSHNSSILLKVPPTY